MAGGRRFGPSDKEKEQTVTPLGWILVGVLSLIVLSMLAARPLRKAMQEAQLAEARRQFQVQREGLEAKFVQLAESSGKPRGLRWVNCEFADDVSYARDRKSARLTAMVACTISFEAIEGGGMEDVEAVGNLRAASAAFNFEHNRWSTDGRAIFNLSPTQAIAHFNKAMVPVGQETTQAS
jgi:hypothetical protein